MNDLKNRKTEPTKTSVLRQLATVIRKIPEERKSQEAILPDTRFIRIWNDQRYEVIARDSGFEYDGRIFRSLSVIAREITGTRWNGKIFFGLKNSHRKKEDGPNA